MIYSRKWFFMKNQGKIIKNRKCFRKIWHLDHSFSDISPPCKTKFRSKYLSVWKIWSNLSNLGFLWVYKQICTKTSKQRWVKMMKNAARGQKNVIFSSPTVGARNVYAECGPWTSHTLQHGHYMRIHPRMNIGLFIWKSSYKATCCLLSTGSCFVRYPQIGGKSN